MYPCVHSISMRVRKIILPFFIFILFTLAIYNYYTESVRFTVAWLNNLFFITVLLLLYILFAFEMTYENHLIQKILYGFLICIILIMGLCGISNMVFKTLEGSSQTVYEVENSGYRVSVVKSGGCGAASCTEFHTIIQQKNIMPGIEVKKTVVLFEKPISIQIHENNMLEVMSIDGDYNEMHKLKPNVLF